MITKCRYQGLPIFLLIYLFFIYFLLTYLFCENMIRYRNKDYRED